MAILFIKVSYSHLLQWAHVKNGNTKQRPDQMYSLSKEHEK